MKPRPRSPLADWALPIAFVVVGIAVAGRGVGDRRPIASSYGTGPAGTRAFHQALVEAGYSVRRFHGSFHELPRGIPHLLVVAAPSGEPITTEEAQRLLDWVGEGNILLYLADGERITEEGNVSAQASDRRLLARLGITLLPPLGLSYDPSRRIPVVPPSFPGRFTHGCGGIFVGQAGGALHSWPVRVPLYADRGIEYGTMIPHLTGRVFFFATVAPIANRTIGLAGNAEAMLAIIGGHPVLRDVLFDEFHHSGVSRQAWARVASHPAFRAATLQALVLVGLFLHVSGRRFGPIGRLPEERRRSGREFIESMACLYRRAGPAGAILQAILRGLRYDMWRRHGVPLRAGSDAAAARLAAIAGRPVAEVRTLLTECESLAARPRVAHADLLGAANRLYQTFERKMP